MEQVKKDEIFMQLFAVVIMILGHIILKSSFFTTLMVTILVSYFCILKTLERLWKAGIYWYWFDDFFVRCY